MMEPQLETASGKNSELSTFRRSLPLLITHFVNQAGDIGLSLLPMLLVARAMNSESSSLVMTLVKLCIAIGTFLGGWSSDRLGLRRTLLLSLFIAALGMGALPFSTSLLAIALTAALAQVGQAMFHSPARMLLSEIVPREKRPEALAWLRVANNAGSMIVFLLGSVIPGASFVFLMLFDCTTTLVAFATGLKFVPRPRKALPLAPAQESCRQSGLPARTLWPPFLTCAATLAGYSLLYNFFYVSLAARLQLQSGSGGVHLFAQLMLLGTLLCTVLSVPAARWVNSRRGGLMAGVGLVTAGSALALADSTASIHLYGGIILVSGGEIIFNAVAQPALVDLTPSSAAPGRAYAVGLMIQSSGRVLGAALAFPLAVYGHHWAAVLTGVTAATFLLSLRVPRHRAHEHFF